VSQSAADVDLYRELHRRFTEAAETAEEVALAAGLHDWQSTLIGVMERPSPAILSPGRREWRQIRAGILPDEEDVKEALQNRIDLGHELHQVWQQLSPPLRAALPPPPWL
jgi:hypothetical protein